MFNELGGTPDAGGTWSGPSAVIGGMFDPATMLGGVYTYTITVPPPCVNASSTVTMTVVQPPNAGIDGSLTLCISSPSTALFPALGGAPQAGGSWSGPSNVVGGMFNPATMTAGVYTYTVNGTAPCPNDAATVTVTVVDVPDPGGPGFITLCATDVAVDLFLSLEGSPDQGGGWTTPSGGVFSGSFDPASNTPGVYTYTISVPPPCASVSSTVTVDVVQPPNAGADGALTLCISSPSTPLFPSLGGSPDASGTWATPSGGAFAGSFDPALHTAGNYTYTVPGTAPCPADIAVVSVVVLTTPDPGIDGTLTLCASDAPSILFNSLLGAPDAGGVWTAPSGTAFGTAFDPAIHATGVYTYTINAPLPCTSVSSTVTVDVVQPPDAGANGAITVCATGAPVDLFLSLTGSPNPGGSWVGPGGAFIGPFDPTIHAAGTYVYTVAGIAPCPAASASVTVGITQEPFAGNDAILNLCVSGTPVDAFPSLGGADLGGTWTGPGGVAFGGIFTPGADVAGLYTYTVVGTAPCPSDAAVVTITVLSDADAGIDGASTLCSTNAPVPLFGLLQGSPDPGGIWLAPNGAPFNGSFDAALSSQGVYTYVLAVPAPCVNDTALVTMAVVQAVDAGSNGSATLCSDDVPIALFAQLGGAPNAGGSWVGPGGFAGTTFDPNLNTPGVFTYTVLGTPPCPNATAQVTIAVNPLPNAGTNGSTTVCPEAPPVQLFALLGGSPMPGGTWTGPSGIPSNGLFSASVDPQGIYTYTVFGAAPCPNVSASSTVSIFIVTAPNAGADAISCDLGYTLNATGSWSSGTWTGPAGTIFGDANEASTTVTVPSGGPHTFTWSISSVDGCASSDAVTIIFTDAIVPIMTSTDAICNGACDGTASVATTGGNTVGGVYSYQWSGGIAANVPNAVAICAGSYTVTVLDMNGCNEQASFIIDEPVPLVIDAILATDETCPGSCDGTILVSDPEGVAFSVNGGSYQPTPLFTGLCPGSFVVLMQDANGCSATGSTSLSSPPPVVAGFVEFPDTLFINDPTAVFTNTSSANATTFSWDFAGLGTSTAFSPSFTFPVDWAACTKYA
ncbi:MAG: SprB repeat-containing protein [Flavobacteriales bacterium]|nr:SprB repeat-containing protein [Flavobacteriales bacterium]